MTGDLSAEHALTAALDPDNPADQELLAFIVMMLGEPAGLDLARMIRGAKVEAVRRAQTVPSLILVDDELAAAARARLGYRSDPYNQRGAGVPPDTCTCRADPSTADARKPGLHHASQCPLWSGDQPVSNPKYTGLVGAPQCQERITDRFATEPGCQCTRPAGHGVLHRCSHDAVSDPEPLTDQELSDAEDTAARHRDDDYAGGAYDSLSDIEGHPV